MDDSVQYIEHLEGINVENLPSRVQHPPSVSYLTFTEQLHPYPVSIPHSVLPHQRPKHGTTQPKTEDSETMSPN